MIRSQRNSASYAMAAVVAVLVSTPSALAQPTSIDCDFVKAEAAQEYERPGSKLQADYNEWLKTLELSQYVAKVSNEALAALDEETRMSIRSYNEGRTADFDSVFKKIRTRLAPLRRRVSKGASDKGTCTIQYKAEVPIFNCPGAHSHSPNRSSSFLTYEGNGHSKSIFVCYQNIDTGLYKTICNRLILEDLIAGNPVSAIELARKKMSYLRIPLSKDEYIEQEARGSKACDAELTLNEVDPM